ncbi:MAG TPA: hypothetical protein VLQ65_16745, partial [Saliniramus sp.]|nr:hypothetical protein [Saliniramus sp.]
GDRAIGRRGRSITEEVKGAVAEIRSRQSALEGESRQRSHDEILKSLRGDIAKLAVQLETVRPDRAREDRAVSDLRRDIDGLQGRLGGLATREEIVTLEKTLAELTQEAVKAADAGRAKELESVTQVIARVESELSGLSELVAGGVHQRIAKDYDALARKIDAMAETGIDPRAIATMTRELESIRGAFSELADADRVQDLSDQVSELSRQIGQMARSQVDAIEFATLRSAVDEIRGAVKASRASQADADQMVDQFAQLTAKLDELPERIPQADLHTLSNQYESVAQQIANLAAEQPRQQIARLSEQVEGMAAKLEEMSGQLTRAQAQAMASEIEAMSADLTHLPQADRAADIKAIHRQFEALTAKVDGLVARPLVADLSPVARQLEALEKKIEESWKSRDEKQAPSPEIMGRLDALTSQLDRFQAEPKPAFDTLIARIDQLDEKLRLPQEPADLKPLEDMLSQLAARLDAAERPNAGFDTVEALEGQIAELMKRMTHSEGSDPALSSLERSMTDLMSQIEVMRDGAVEAAERAAKAAIADTLEAFPKDEARGAEELDFLTRSLMDLKTSQTEAERRSIDKMGSVQDTLDRLVERLAMLEDRGRQSQAAAPRTSGPKASSAKPPAGEAERKPRDLDLRLPQAAIEERGHRVAVKSLEDAAKAHIAAAGGRALLAEADKPIGGTGSLGGDVLLEPGSGRPKPSQPRQEHADIDDASDIKASFIAAARRAAQTAAAEAAATANEPVTAHPREPISRHSADPSGLAGRMRQMIASKRRPLLMGVAAILLAIGAFQMNARFLVEGNSDDIAAAEATRLEQSAEATLPAPSPRLEASGSDNGRLGPETTAAIDINSLLDSQPGFGTTGVIGADDFINGDVRRTQEGSPGSDGDAADRFEIDQVPSPQLFPSIVSADEIPESIGPAPLRDAVLAGDINAVYELASRATDGRGIARDQKLAAKLFERAAAHGLVPAQYRIGNHYEKGLGVTRDFSLAALWYQRAAESGNARAMHNLAVLLAEGVNGSPDYEAAVGWFSRAAEYGVRDSQYNLAVLLARGLGATQDLSGSYTWFAIAAAQGDDDAGAKRDEVAGRLGEAELALAKAKVEIWRPKAPRAEANEVAMPAHGWNDAPAPQAVSRDVTG